MNVRVPRKRLVVICDRLSNIVGVIRCYCLTHESCANTFSCIVKSFNFVIYTLIHLISCILWVGQSTNLRFQQMCPMLRYHDILCPRNLIISQLYVLLAFIYKISRSWRRLLINHINLKLKFYMHSYRWKPWCHVLLK